MTMKAQTSTNHMGNQATGLFPVHLNQSFRKSVWIIQKDEGCFWTWKSSRRELSLPHPHLMKNLSSPWSTFKWGTITEANTFWAVTLRRPRAMWLPRFQLVPPSALHSSRPYYPHFQRGKHDSQEVKCLAPLTPRSPVARLSLKT